MSNCEFNEEIMDLVTQMSLTEQHLEWDANQLDVMKDIILSFEAQIQDQYQLWVQCIPCTQPGSILHSLQHSSYSSDFLNKPTAAVTIVADMGRSSKDFIQQLRIKLLWYQRSILQEIVMSGCSSGSSLLVDHVSEMIRLLMIEAAHV